MLKEIEKSICIEPEFLNQDIKQHLLEKARTTWVGKCTKEDGYILKIHSIKKIVNNHISPSTTSIIFELLLKAEVIKPEIDMVFEAKVNMIVSKGIFVCADEKINIFISVVDNYEFDEGNNTYVNVENKNIKIKPGDKVNVKITAIRYEKNSFKCIGELKEE